MGVMWGPVVMGRDYTGEIGEGKGIFLRGRWGPQGTSPVVRRAWCESQGVDFIGGFLWALGVC